MGGQEFVDELLVFLRFEAASAVDECAAGFEQGCGLVQEFELEGTEAGDFFGGDAPAKINAAAHDASVGARCVEENLVEVRRQRGERQVS